MSGPNDTVPRSLKQHRSRRYCPHGDVGEVLSDLKIAETANHVFRPAHLQQPAAHFIGAAADLLNDCRERNVVGLKFVRIELDLILPDEAADGGDFGDARNGFELVANVPILKAAQIRQAVLVAVVNENIFVDPAGAGRVGPEHGINAGRQLALQLLQVFEHPRARPVEIRAVLEDDVHVGIAEHGLRAHCLDLRRGEHRGDDGVGHLVFDDVGRLARPVGVDDDLHVGNIRQSVERNVSHGPDSGQDQQEDSRENQEAVARAPVNPAGYHVTSPLRRSRSVACWPGSGRFFCATTVTCQVPPAWEFA